MKLPGAARLQRIEFLTAVVFTIALIGLHLVVLNSAGPLWRDEISSLTLATRPTWGELCHTLIYDPFPALFFTTLRAWHALFGGSDFVLRCYGFVIGLFCITGFWVSARWTKRRTPLLALALFGFSPTLIIWGDSLRSYGLAVCCIVISFAAFWVVINDSRPSYVLAAVGAAVLSAQAIFTNALLVFACGMAAAIVAGRRGQWKRALIPLCAGAVAAVSLVPYAGVLRATKDWADIRKFPLPVQVHLGVLREALLNGGTISFWFWAGLALAAILVAVGSQFQKNSADSPDGRDARLYALIAGLLGCGTTLLFFHRLQWPSNVWYYLPMLALVAMALDLILDFGSEFRAATAGRIVLTGACLLCSLPVVLARIQVRASNLDVIASILEKHAGTNDLIVIYPFVDGITFNRYFHGAAPWITIPKIDDLSLHRWDQFMEQARLENAIAPMLDRINETLRTGHQVWVATTFPLVAPAGPAPPVLPLNASQPRRIGYFLGGWRELLVADLREHAEYRAPVNIPLEQSVSKYERSRLFVFSGWKDSAGEQR